MKKIYTLIALFTGILAANAQTIPNSGFENWSVQQGVGGNFDVATDWASVNYLNLLATQPPSIFKETQSVHGGTAACKISTVKLVSNPYPLLLKDTMGATFTGQIGITGVRLGFPCLTKPAQLTFYAKYAPVGIDTAYGLVFITKRTGSNVDTLGTGYVSINGAVANYTQYVATILYNQQFISLTPDTAMVFFSSSGNRPKIGSTLWVDDAAFAGTFSSIDEGGVSSGVSVFPNPAKDQVNFVATSVDAEEVVVFDLTGKKIDAYLLNDKKVKIYTTSYAAGIYTYSVLDKDKKILSRGKFEVTK